jgi:hypothetical protein
MSQENQLANGSLPHKRREQLEYIKKIITQHCQRVFVHY